MVTNRKASPRRSTIAAGNSGHYPDVDVAIMMESTYPYLKGGVSAVVHDIVKGNQDLCFGIIHITWDSNSAREDLYGMPANVLWVYHVYLSMQEHRREFMQAKPDSLRMPARGRERLAERLFSALRKILDGDMSDMWQLYDEGLNPRTRQYPLWALLGTKEFMHTARKELDTFGLPLMQTFWLLREFFSLAYALLHETMPKAAVYHAHTTGYASLLGSAAARQHGTKFLLTEHNLYVRDTINMLLGRSLALTISSQDWRDFDVTPVERAWMAWWIEMGRFCYPSAEIITYLYPSAVTEAADLGSPVGKSVVIPNGMVLENFETVYQQRKATTQQILAKEGDRTWRLAYIARVVPIKGLSDLIDTVALMEQRGGSVKFHLDVMGPTTHDPDYYMLCREKVRTLGLEELVTFRGTVNVRDLLGELDLLVLPSYNEGQPIVVLEAMTAGVPIVGTNVGGMAELVLDPLTTPGGVTWGPCGVLVEPAYAGAMADALERVMGDTELYASLVSNGRGRVENFYLLDDVLGAYNRLYKELAGRPAASLDESAALVDPYRRELPSVPPAAGHPEAGGPLLTTLGLADGDPSSDEPRGWTA